jgi:superfamily I DNA and RNA helicase
MLEKKFLEKYGNEKVEFVSMNKFRAFFRNEKLKIWCSGTLEYREDISRVETVNSVFNLDNFHFGFMPSSDSCLKEMKQIVLNAISDLSSDFLYYDRKEDEDLTAEQLNEAVRNGEITIEEMVQEFRKHLENRFTKPSE